MVLHQSEFETYFWVLDEPEKLNGLKHSTLFCHTLNYREKNKLVSWKIKFFFLTDCVKKINYTLPFFRLGLYLKVGDILLTELGTIKLSSQATYFQILDLLRKISICKCIILFFPPLVTKNNIW